ncbi:MAG: glutamine--fructose-6-phosphate transaminase (isomerizing) [Alphaproteobacteria bacterium]|nr:MAG: glutamine--fructose-6-phosphate transaminase (isomerizing) [Alphaproteobacteria bacterium]
MCGIVGIVGERNASEFMIEGLKRLEYRGYDSAGLATLIEGSTYRRRAEGKLSNLIAELDKDPLDGSVGIGHTRWATHGAPNTQNAHPHQADGVMVVHNGIIENYMELRDELLSAGKTFSSVTDTEVVAQLVSFYLAQTHNPVDAVGKTLKRLEGAFAFAMIFDGHPDLMIAARRGSPLAIGLGDGENYIGSDAFSLAPITNKVIYLEDGDWAEIHREKIQVYDSDNHPISRPVTITSASAALVDKGNHRHFMAKEIFEQPDVIGHTLGAYIDAADRSLKLPALPFDLATLPRITIIACGTAFYAALVAKYWLEQVARVPTEVDIASEFRYREAALPEGGLAIMISQSGETADTLAALRYCKAHKQHVVSVVNVKESTIARESDLILPTYAGPEIGVASTKAFTCQLSVLAILTLAVGKARGVLTTDDEKRLLHLMQEVPRHIAEVLAHEEAFVSISHDLSRARDVLFLGRGIQYPIALEGALKLKEISYIHAEGYAAGELKHGPIALIDENMPVVVIAPCDQIFEKSVSNMHEVIARGGEVILISDKGGISQAGADASVSFEMPDVDPFIAPIIYAVPVQLLAYHTAVHKGTDVDQPRNLAKSVTVE